MSTWNAGYRTDIHYTYGYYKELSPTYLKFMLLLKGYDVLNQEDQCHCELGFGQGMSINIHAATHNSHFVGTDFNPSHAAFANYLTQQTHSSTQLYDDSFEQLLARDLPSFDSITLHGIWSWISAENKQYILDFILKFLKPGGVVYISYNTLPGWLALLPVRELFKETYKYATSGQDSIQRTKDAMAMTLETLKNSAAFSHMSPKSIEQFENLKTQDLNYVSHEYLNNDWHCVTFSDMQQLMQEHKLDFAGKADFSNYTEFLSYTNEQQEYLKTIQSPILKEQTTDFLTNNRFRRDIYVRGGIRLTSAQITHKLEQTRFILNMVAKSHSNKIQGTAGEFNLKEEIYEPIVEFLASEHYRAKSFAELKKKFPEMSLFVLVQAICILCQKSEVSPCQDEIQINYESAHAFNAFILNNATLEHKLFTLASPLTGQGMQVGYTTLLFLNAIWVEKLTQSKQWAKYAAEIVVNLNLILYDKDRQSLTQYDDVHTELLRLAKEFQQSDWLKVFEAHKLYEVN